MNVSQFYNSWGKVACILATISISLLVINTGSMPVAPTANPLPTKTSVVNTGTEVKSTPALPKKDWQQARLDYQLARNMLAKGDFSTYLTFRKKLTDYPLYPYLEYQYLRQHLTKSNTAQIKKFIHTWSDTPLAGTLKHRWLKKLAKTGQWRHYLDNDGSNVKSTELQCYALWAKHKVGLTEEALSDVSELWLVNHSQPKACNPIFELWIKNNHLTEAIVWQRFEMVLNAGNTELANYLSRLMSTKRQRLAKLAREIYVNPKHLEKLSRFKPFNNEHRHIIVRGFKRLARQDSLLAYQLWPEYQKIQKFDTAEISQINRKIMLWLAHQDNSPTYQDALQRFPSLVDDDILEAGIRLAIRQQNWPLITFLTDSLSPDTKNSTRNQYWLAQAQLKTGSRTIEEIHKSLQELSQQRDYYSFLAADFFKKPYQMNHQHYPIDGNFLAYFKQLPSIARARELLKTKQITEARREWYRTTLPFDNNQHYIAAHHAQQIGWNSQAIRSAITAKRWHDLELRFPLSFEQTIEEAAHHRHLNSNWLFAMARQESALTPEAVSPAGARGLIQIMPATARNVAKKYKIPYHSRQQLFDPIKNAQLASAYLSSLLKQFKGNDIYATAAYNAGPNRVKEWLKTTSHLPIDVWIESIPFHETRQYVKNVLTYSVIYAHRRNQANVQMATTKYLPKHDN